MLDEREAGLEYPVDGYLLVEPDEWEYDILPHIRKIPNAEIASMTRLCRREIIRLNQGKHRPSKVTIRKLLKCCNSYHLI